MLVVIVGVAVWWWTSPSIDTVDNQASAGQTAADSDQGVTALSLNTASPPSLTSAPGAAPDSLRGTSHTSDKPGNSAHTSVATEDNQDSANLFDGSTELALSDADLAALGTEPFANGEFELLTALLREQPELLQRVLDEFRANTDPYRARYLAELLGQFDDAAVIATAEQMVYSGDVASASAALKLLGRQQRHSAQAREVIGQVLEAETNELVLVPALNAISVASRATAEQRQSVVGRLLPLAEHTDPQVRSHSYALLGVWNRDRDLNEVLLQGVNDQDARVRESAIISLGKSGQRNESVKSELFSRVENTQEDKFVRIAAVTALRKFPLSADETQRIQSLTRELGRK